MKEVCKQSKVWAERSGRTTPTGSSPQSSGPVPPLPLALWSSPFLARGGLLLSGLLGVSGDGAVAAAGAAAALLLLVQLEPLTRVVALPQSWSLEDLLHQLLKGTLDAVFGLCAGL